MEFPWTFLRSLILVVGFGSFSQMSFAQANLRISYDLSYFQSSVNQELTEAFNTQNSFVADGKALRPLNFVNGLSMGVAYKTTYSRFELGYSTAFRTRESFGEKPAMGSEPASSFSTTMRYRLSGVYLNAEIVLNKFGAGVRLASDGLQMKSDIVGSSNDKIITNQRLYSISPFLNFQLYQGNSVSVHLRPQVKFYLQGLNHSEIYQFLDLESPQNLVDRPYSIGVSLIFYNGPQN